MSDGAWQVYAEFAAATSPEAAARALGLSELFVRRAIEDQRRTVRRVTLERIAQHNPAVAARLEAFVKGCGNPRQHVCAPGKCADYTECERQVAAGQPAKCEKE